MGIFLAVEVYFDLCRLENSHVTAAATLLALAALPSMLANAATAALLARAAMPSVLADAGAAALLAAAASPPVLADAAATALLADAALPPVLADAGATALFAAATSPAMRTGRHDEPRPTAREQRQRPGSFPHAHGHESLPPLIHCSPRSGLT